MSNQLLGQYIFAGLLAAGLVVLLALVAWWLYPLYLTAPRDIIRGWWQGYRRWRNPATPEEQDWLEYSALLEETYYLRQVTKWLVEKPSEMSGSVHQLLQRYFDREASQRKLVRQTAGFLLQVAPERLPALAEKLAVNQQGQQQCTVTELHQFLIQERMLIRAERDQAGHHLDRLEQLLEVTQDKPKVTPPDLAKPA